MSEAEFKAEYECRPSDTPRELVAYAAWYIAATDAFDIAVCGRDGIPKTRAQSIMVNRNAIDVMWSLCKTTVFSEGEIRRAVKLLQRESQR